MRVRGEAFGLFSSSSATFIPPLIHDGDQGGVGDVAWEIFLGIVQNGLFDNFPHIKSKALDQCI